MELKVVEEFSSILIVVVLEFDKSIGMAALFVVVNVVVVVVVVLIITRIGSFFTVMSIPILISSHFCPITP